VKIHSSSPLEAEFLRLLGFGGLLDLYPRRLELVRSGTSLPFYIILLLSVVLPV